MRISDWSSDVCSSDLYHPTVEAYLAAKLRLFDSLLPADGAAVINMDSAVGAQVEALCAKRGQRLIRYGQLGTELRLLAAVPHAGGLDIEAEVFGVRSEEHTSELQSLMRISYAVFCLKKQNTKNNHRYH